MSVTIRLKQDEPVTLAVLSYLSDFTNNFVLEDIEDRGIIVTYWCYYPSESICWLG